jgi:hypothetical protein
LNKFILNLSSLRNQLHWKRRLQTQPQSSPDEAQPNKVTINQPVDTLIETPVDDKQLSLNFNTNEKDELFLIRKNVS